MKRLVFVFIPLIVIVFNSCCFRSEKYESWDYKAYYSSIEAQDLSQYDDAARIVVNGTDITNNQYFRYKYHETQTEIPLLAVLAELGADLMISTDNKEVLVRYKDFEKVLYLDANSFGILVVPGTRNWVAEIRNSVLIVDTSVSRYMLPNYFNAQITFDDESKTIFIDN